MDGSCLVCPSVCCSENINLENLIQYDRSSMGSKF